MPLQRARGGTPDGRARRGLRARATHSAWGDSDLRAGARGGAADAGRQLLDSCDAVGAAYGFKDTEAVAKGGQRLKSRDGWMDAGRQHWPEDREAARDLAAQAAIALLRASLRVV